MERDDLVVFVTELARRQFVRREVLEKGFVDASRLLTFTRLRAACVQSARQAGLLAGRELTDTHRIVLSRRAAQAARKLFPPDGRLNVLSLGALTDTLTGLVDSISPFGDHAEAVHEWLSAQQPASGKLHQLGALYREYRRLCAGEGVADTRDVNAALLRLLRGPKNAWPRLLADLNGAVVFRSVRWLNAFEEAFVLALKQRLGPDRVKVYSALPSAHAEKVEDRVAARIRSEVMMGVEDAWTGWAEGLTDALAVEDAAVALESRERVSFTRSMGLYGEVEDAARRIRWEIEHGVAPDRIALVVRNLGDYADAITHVFERFGIPSFFRRGLPASSAPLVKILLSLLSLPLTWDRDRFCALLQSAPVDWKGFPDLDARRAAAHDLLAAGVGPRISAETIRRCLDAYDARPDARPEEKARAAARTQAVLRAVARLRGLAGAAPLSEHASRSLELVNDLGLERPPAPGEPNLARHVFNLRALESALGIVRELARAAASDPDPRPLADFLDLLEQSLENATVSPGGSDERGVWVLNPFDAAGLRFDVVVLAGLNEGVFPAVCRQDSLFGDDERLALRDAMKKRGIELPLWSLPESALRSLQESVLFLICLGAGRERLALSYRACDTDGRDLVPGDFFRSVWSLAGWPSAKDIVVAPYDAWRIKELGKDSWPARHLERQRKTAPYERLPMPGESFLSTVPLPLCCAADEARQRIARSTEDPAAQHESARVSPKSKIENRKSQIAGASLASRLDIELSRDLFFSAPAAERPAAEPYCGKLGGEYARRFAEEWIRNHDEFSPTSLETLAKCRFRFLMARILGLGALRTQEDAPDVMDRGKVIHEALNLLYRALSGRTKDLETLTAIPKRFAGLCRPGAWAKKTASGGWQLSDRPADLPLVAIAPEQAPLCEEFTEFVADAVFAWVEKAAEPARLGDPGVWATEKPKIRRIVANYLGVDAENAAAERRFPAFFELTFGRQRDDAKADLEKIALNAARPVLVHGQVDRVDLVFGEDGALAGLLVIDYKSTSRGNKSQDVYAEEIVANLNCQLPVYAFVAQHFFFGAHNRPELNALTQAVYHIQDRNLKGMTDQFAKRRIPLGAEVEGEGALAALFLDRLTDHLARLAKADFSVDPQDCQYCDFANICRVDVNAIESAGNEN